jgi:hypothetical protein
MKNFHHEITGSSKAKGKKKTGLKKVGYRGRKIRKFASHCCQSMNKGSDQLCISG